MITRRYWLVGAAVAMMIPWSGRTPVFAQTPDGQTPAVESVCNGLEGALFGLCNAYCEALDCGEAALHEIESRECGKLLVNFQRKAGRLPPCYPVKCGATFPQCNGKCPDKAPFCLNLGKRGGCQCAETLPKCGSELDPECNGDCGAGRTCVAQGEKCTCVEGSKCGGETDPQCDGTCPPDAPVCFATAEKGHCVCLREAPKCGSVDDPQCDGACPTDTPNCVSDGKGNCFCK